MESRIINISKSPDLKLAVGSNHDSCLIADPVIFNVNRGCVLEACRCWRALLNGVWKEARSGAIEFPDDSPFAFEIILHMVHMDFAQLPEMLSAEDLNELTVLIDKYDLTHIVSSIAPTFDWTKQYHEMATTLFLDPDLQHAATVLSTFGHNLSRDLVFQRLSLELYEDPTTRKLAYGEGASKVILDLDLGSSKFASILQTRRHMLQELEKIARVAVEKLAIPCRWPCRCGEECSREVLDALQNNIHSVCTVQYLPVTIGKAVQYPSISIGKEISVLSAWVCFRGIGRICDETHIGYLLRGTKLHEQATEVLTRTLHEAILAFTEDKEESDEFRRTREEWI